jgi:hypothetical protein
MLAAQQGWLEPPQVAHFPLEHTVAAALHVFPVQHASSVPPQATHCPVVPHSAPSAQRAPQQGCPTAPHETHVLDELQLSPVPQSVPQQG